MKRSQLSAQMPEFRSLWPFWVTALAWGLLGVVVNAVSPDPFWNATLWQILVWLACVLDFAVTAQLLKGMLSLRAGPDDIGATGTRTLAWGLAKLACLGLIGVVLWASRSAPTRSILMGIATLVVVPLLGGLWWYQKEESNGERRP